MTKRTLLTTLAGLAACGALAPAGASAAPAYQAAAFKADVRGTQVTTWEYHEDTLKDDPCGTKIDSYGDQTIRFASPGNGTGRVLVGRPPNGKPSVTATASGDGVFWEIPAQAERTGTYKVAEVDRSKCEGPNGGGVVQRREDKDCGTRYGWLRADTEALSRSRLTFGGDTADWNVGALGTEKGQSLEDTYRDCPFWVNGVYAPEAEGNLLPAPEQLPLKALLNPRRRKIVIDFGYTKNYGPEHGFSGRTVVTAKLTLTRTKLTAAG